MPTEEPSASLPDEEPNVAAVTADAPAVEFMPKPFSPKALTERVDEIMSASV